MQSEDLHRIIQHPIQIVLIVAGRAGVPVKDFPDAVDACGVVVARPEVLLDVFDGIDAEAVHYIFPPLNLTYNSYILIFP